MAVQLMIGVLLGALGSASASEAASVRTTDELLARVDPWVVAIRVKRKKDIEARRTPFALPPSFVSPEARDYYRRPEGWVTGFLVDARGHVLTSHYNVAGEVEKIEVVLPGGSHRSAGISARDEMDDLALLSIEGEEPAVAEERWREPPWSEESLVSGRFLFAVGRSPDPTRLTLTQGIVSATGRNGGRAVQTDCKLNYGNVGGPVIDLDGRIVGISGFVGHVWPQWGVNSGIGFATTTSAVREVLGRLVEGRDVEPPEAPFLGVQSDPEDILTRGAKVEKVLAGSSAARAGLKDGDVIIEFDGRPLLHFNQLRRYIFDHSVGDRVKLKVKRGEKELVLEVELGNRRP